MASAFALSIYFSLFASVAQMHHAGARLAEIILSKARFKIATGFAGTPILGHALAAVRQTQLFYRMLLHRKNPSWLYPVTMGATAVWERWDSMLLDGSISSGMMTAFNRYSLGTVADWMHKAIGGLRAVEPGWRKVPISPACPKEELLRMLRQVSAVHTGYSAQHGVLKERISGSLFSK
ncbi:Fc.00g026890.m01.CDS01 [Cosmosporella sp. VM-42]